MRALAAGEHVRYWDGTHGDGMSLAAGAYFYELRCAGERLQRRLILLR